MKATNSKTKSTKFFLANSNGIEIYLNVPGKDAKEQKYYLDYNHNGQKKYYGKGSVKTKSIEFFNSLEISEKIKQSEIEASLTEIFKQDILLITHELQNEAAVSTVSMRSNVREAIEAFFLYKTLQNKEGTVDKVSLCGYKHHSNKLLKYFSIDRYKRICLSDLSTDLWLNYRIDLLNNTYNTSTKKLINASVNQHFQYVTQFYGWLMDYNEFPIKNHLKKLKKLNSARQDKRFKVIPDNLFNEFYHLLEFKEKYTFTRLYLSGLLLYENNIRLAEQVLIQVGNIDFEYGTLKIINKKNDSLRTVILSSKAQELITIIRNNTIKYGLTINKEMYLYGGHNIFKLGKPHRNKELATLMRRFRKLYPQFNDIKLYENKHTSITNQFNAGVDHYLIKERANHSSISTTEIYLQTKRIVKPYELKTMERDLNEV
ncbi:hypothetical protein AY601_5061 [Pedobacter cryoconitis]|uniref:Site-specific recombinase XerD n=1 Tax=Pedobacter cryoconitis TaxID=188932 RepID=A0A127VKL4_9SPHI|nr:site-specific integrase [Pedobacter cryoconitis]AMQ01874.1 hypothetical protein AY601_5061 [Pedobacter cryoconitis]